MTPFIIIALIFALILIRMMSKENDKDYNNSKRNSNDSYYMLNKYRILIDNMMQSGGSEIESLGSRSIQISLKTINTSGSYVLKESNNILHITYSANLGYLGPVNNYWMFNSNTDQSKIIEEITQTLLENYKNQKYHG